MIDFGEIVVWVVLGFFLKRTYDQSKLINGIMDEWEKTIELNDKLINLGGDIGSTHDAGEEFNDYVNSILTNRQMWN